MKSVVDATFITESAIPLQLWTCDALCKFFRNWKKMKLSRLALEEWYFTRHRISKTIWPPRFPDLPPRDYLLQVAIIKSVYSTDLHTVEDNHTNIALKMCKSDLLNTIFRNIVLGKEISVNWLELLSTLFVVIISVLNYWCVFSIVYDRPV